MRNRLALGAVLTIAALLAAGFLVARLSGGDDSLERLKRADVIRVGYAVEAPHAFLTPKGQVTGQSPELARLVIARLGIGRVNWRLMEFSQLLDALERGHIDVIAAGMYITPERAQRATFSEPIFHASQGLLVARGNPHGLHSYEDLRTDPTLRAAVLAGAVEEKMLRRMGVADQQLVEVPDASTGKVAVETGMADALALSAPTIAWMAGREQLGKTEQAEPFRQPEPAVRRDYGYGAFVFPKNDRKFVDAWNKEQRTVMERPEFKTIMDAFGFLPADYPGDAATSEILHQ